MYFSRAVMPESFMLLATIAAVYFFMRWLRDRTPFPLIAWLVSFTLAVTIKPYMLHLALPMLVVAWRERRTRPFEGAITLCLFAISGLAVAAYFAYAHSLFRQTGLTFGIFDAVSGKWFNAELYTFDYLKKLAITRFFSEHFNWALVPAVAGFVFTLRNERAGFFRWWLAGLAVFFLVVNRGNYLHIHYQLPAIFAVSFFSATGLMKLHTRATGWSKAPAVVLLLLFTATSAGVSALLFATERTDSKTLLAELPPIAHRVASVSPEIFSQTELSEIASAISLRAKPEDRIVVAGNTAPLFFYASQRRGWRFTLAQVSDSLLAALRNRGAVCLVVNARSELSAKDWAAVRSSLIIPLHEQNVCGMKLYVLQP
jgi:hypothetical protein